MQTAHRSRLSSSSPKRIGGHGRLLHFHFSFSSCVAPELPCSVYVETDRVAIPLFSKSLTFEEEQSRIEDA